MTVGAVVVSLAPAVIAGALAAPAQGKPGAGATQGKGSGKSQSGAASGAAVPVQAASAALVPAGLTPFTETVDVNVVLVGMDPDWAT